jgi:hypothetical protein
MLERKMMLRTRGIYPGLLRRDPNHAGLALDRQFIFVE